VKSNNRKPARRRRGRGGRTARSTAAAVVDTLPVAASVVPTAPPDGISAEAAAPEAPGEPVAASAAPPVELPPPPETAFAARVPPPEPPRPLPTTRRAIFFDVENTSRPEHIARVLEHLRVDRLGRQTDLIAVGNWRVASPDSARLLARNGAQLVHSAPSTGVRDWSDLRIAVSAGVWLAAARAGDVIEIVSDDRAFDAVGDVAATLGVGYRRLSFRSLAGLPATEAPAADEPAEPRGRRRRGRRGRGHHERAPRPAAAPHVRHHEPPRPPAPRAADEAAGPHTAPHDEIVGVARELIEGSDRRAVTIDALANALKSRGFSRTPGSPRLITRLRRIKELEVSRNGLITLTGQPGGVRPAPPPEPEVPVEMPAAEAPVEAPGPVVVEAEEAVAPGAQASAARRPRRRGRRGGRRHRRRAPETAAAE